MVRKNTNPTDGLTLSPESPGTGVEGRDAARLVPRHDSRALFGRNRELVIEHAGHDYRLRITRQGKLILTK
jgi:hemin uptake protein HemP